MRFSEEVQSKLTIMKVKEWETFQIVLRLLGKVRPSKRKMNKTSGGLKSILCAGLLAMMLVAAPFNGIAAESDGSAVAVMDEVVVTATKTEEKRKDIVNSVVIIDAIDIAEAPAESIGSLLANEPGIDWRTRGNYGGATEEIQIRGMDADGTQVLVNGVVANSASLGSADVGLIPMNNIEKVEVVKGPGSLLYGSGAAGGTVNIITKKPKHDASITKVEAGYGTDATYQLAAETGRFVNDAFGYYLTANHRETDGFRDNSDLDSNDLSLKFLLDKGEALELGFYFDYLDRDYGLPGVNPPEGTTERIINGTTFYNGDSAALLDRGGDENRRSTLEAKGTAVDWLEWRVQGSCSVQESYNYGRYSSSGSGNESSVINTVRGIEGNLDIRPVSMLSILTGTEYNDFNYENEQQSLDSTGAPVSGGYSELEQGAFTQGSFVEASLRPVEQVKLVAGYRYENHSEFGHEDVSRFGLIINPVPETAIKVNHGEHFKAPTMNDLFWPDSGFAKGNTLLKPETGKHSDITVEQELFGGRIFASASWFKWDIDDKIDWAQDPSQPTIVPGWFYYVPTNLYSYQATGWELSATARLPHSLTFDLGLTLLDAEEEMAAGINRQSLYSPDTQFKLGIKHYADFGLTSSMVARYVSDRPGYYLSDTDTEAQIDLKSYWTVDLKLAQELADHWQLVLIGTNLLDEEYDTYISSFYDYATSTSSRQGYSGAGRAVFASVAYSW